MTAAWRRETSRSLDIWEVRHEEDQPDGIAVHDRLFIALASPAQADPPPVNFGEHAFSCAHTMGLGADMSPGMHHGANGWSGMSCQSRHPHNVA